MAKPHVTTLLKERAVENYRNGMPAVSIAKLLGVSRETVHRWCRVKKSRKSLTRISNSLAGRQSKINSDNAEEILRLLKTPAVDYGYETDFWTTARIQQVVKKMLGLKISRMAIHRTLKKLDQSYRKPETQYYSKNKDKEMVEWRKKSVPQIKRILKEHKAILYFQDESNISLTATVGKTWGTKGIPLIKKISPHRGSVSAISALSESGHLVFNVHDHNKRYKSEDIISFLQQMMKYHARRHLVVIMDRAPCHTSKKVRTYIASEKRLHVFFLPPSSPELNPDEKVWDHLKNQELKGHKATTTKELKRLAKSKLTKMSNSPRLMMGIYRRCNGNIFLR